MGKSTFRFVFAVGATLGAAGAATGACGKSYSASDEPGGADAFTPSDGSVPIEGAVAVAADAAAADASAAPVVTIVAAAVADALDFDLRPADVLYLRANPTRVDGCAGTACTPVLDTALMPPESATQTNASVAFLPIGLGSPHLLIAQQGRELCALGCAVDNPNAPGLYSTALTQTPAAATRVAPTVVLAVAKSGRSTNGFLEGRGDTWAVAQATSNEAPSMGFTTVYTAKSSLSSGFSVAPTVTLGRGTQPNIDPFVFAATKTPSSGGGYAASVGDLVDVGADGGGKAGFVPTHAAVTTIDPSAADVFARGTLTPDDVILSFHNAGAQVVQPFPLPGMKKDVAVLTATDRHVVFFGAFDGDGGAAVTMHACPAADILAKTCTPTVLDLPVETILRVRTSGSTVYVLGKSAGVPRLVSVTLP